MRSRILALGALISLVLIGGSSCKTRRALEKSPLLPLSEKAIIEQLAKNSFHFTSLNAKLQSSVRTSDENRSFKINLRMESDSAIWVSITPALGIEAARAVISQDSLKFIDKLNDKYYLGNYGILDSLFGYAAQYDFLENLLVGNPIEISEDEKYVSVVDELYYVIQTKNPRKVRKAVDISLRPDISDSLDAEVIKEKKLKKAAEKFDDEDLIIKRYYVRANDFRVERCIVEDLLTERSVRLEYDHFEEVNGTPFAKEISIFIDSPNETGRFELSYSRIRTNERQSYPFKIPSKYDPLFR
jgi:hypothetical protein